MLLETLQFVVLVIASFVSLLFILSLLIKRNDIADIAWGPGIALASYAAYYSTNRELGTIDITLLTLVSIWAARLGVRILLKNIRKSEDPRYKRWREEWGATFYIRSYLQVYLLQGALMVVLAMPPIIAATTGTDSARTSLVYLGVALWVVGFIFETVGDYQLDAFIKNPESKGKLMTQGLWSYTRHPNYFGEILMWWSIFVIVVSAPMGYLAILSPIVITYLITQVSGVPLLEAQFKDHPDWPEYVRTTNKLIPGPRKS